MIGVLATLCICTVTQDILISPKIALSHVHYINCHTSLPAMPLSILLQRLQSLLHHRTAATALTHKVREVTEKCYIEDWMRRCC